MTNIARYNNISTQLERTTQAGLNEVAARQLITERMIKAVSQVSEFGASEVAYLQAVAQVASTDLDTAQAVGPIVALAVASITRVVGQFGGAL